MQKKLNMIEIVREKAMIRKGIVKEVIERIERQKDSISYIYIYIYIYMYACTYINTIN